MGGKESDSKYLVLWLCVFLTAGIIFVGWFVTLRANFAKTNSEMDSNVNKTFEEAQQEVMDSFEQVQKFIKQTDEEINMKEDATTLATDLGLVEEGKVEAKDNEPDNNVKADTPVK